MNAQKTLGARVRLESNTLFELNQLSRVFPECKTHNELIRKAIDFIMVSGDKFQVARLLKESDEIFKMNMGF